MALSLQSLSIGYSKQQPLFASLNAKAVSGSFVALLGVNGVGKSTMMRTLAGLAKPQAGEVCVNGIPVHNIRITERARQISVVLTDKVRLDYCTVKEFVALGRTPYTNWSGALSDEDNRIVKDALIRCGLADMELKPFNNLSDGEKQKVLIARALSQQTPILLLDEPTAYLDFKNREVVFRLLRDVAEEQQKIVLLSTHDIEMALQYCNRYWILKPGNRFYNLEKTEGDYRKEVSDILQAD